MEQESKINSLHLFHLHWTYEKLKILLNCVDHVNFKFMEYSISRTEFIYDKVMIYILPSISNDETIYDYSSFFSKTCYVDNPMNMKARFK